MTPDDLAAIVRCVTEPDRVITQPQVVERLSRDFYWYSPVLKELLDNKIADAVVQPLTVDEIRAVLACCYARSIPVTARGAGTGNYGQAIPLEGGVVLDLIRMDKIEAIEDGVAIAEPGVRLSALESAAREKGWELRCYPSTIAKASLGGFLGGGSGGIGSVAHGGLRMFDTVRAVEIVTMEENPQVLLRQGEAVNEVLYSWGTNGIITRIWLALTPAVEWAQCAMAFDSFEAAYDFTEAVATGDAWTKRLVTTLEWPIPENLTPILKYTRQGKAMAILMIALDQLDAVQEAARAAAGEVTLAMPYTGLRTNPLLSDYTWNHTTLWSIKQDPTYTYLQCGFNAGRAREQFALLKEKFGGEFLFHIEWMKAATGEVVPGSIPLVRYTTKERLNEMMEFCESIGVDSFNPHVNNVERGGRYRADNVQLLAKYKYDPLGLLNPGKMVTFRAETVPAEKEPA